MERRSALYPGPAKHSAMSAVWKYSWLSSLSKDSGSLEEKTQDTKINFLRKNLRRQRVFSQRTARLYFSERRCKKVTFVLICNSALYKFISGSLHTHLTAGCTETNSVCPSRSTNRLNEKQLVASR